MRRNRDRYILRDAGKVTRQLAKELAEIQFDKFEAARRATEAKNPISDFDKQVNRLDQDRKKPNDPP